MSVGARAIKYQVLRAYAARPPVIKYSPTWVFLGTAETLFTVYTAGARWRAPQSFTLARIEIPLSICAALGDTQCPQGIVELYHNPVCWAGRGTLIATSVVTLPTLPEHPSYVWVPFDFDQAITAGNYYSWLAVGCASYWSNPRYRLQMADDINDGVTLHKLIWFGHLSPPYLSCDPDRDIPYKLYKKG